MKDLRSQLKKEELAELREKPNTNYDPSPSRTNAPSTHTKSKKTLQPGPNTAGATASSKKKNLENEMRAIDNYVNRMHQGRRNKEVADKAEAYRHYDPKKDVSRSRSAKREGSKRPNSDLRTASA